MRSAAASCATPGASAADGTGLEALRRRSKRLLLFMLVGVSLCGLILAGYALWRDPPPELGKSLPPNAAGNVPRTRGTVHVLVRARVHVLDAQDKPVPGARIVAAFAGEEMRTEEDIERIRRAIGVWVTGDRRAWDYAIGTTNQDGIVDLEYIRLDDGDDPLFEEEGQASTEEFPFGAVVRVDAEVCGTVFGKLQDARNVRYRRYRRAEGSKGPWRVAEAEFVFNCARGVTSPESLGPDEEDPAAAVLHIDRMVREAQGKE